MPINGKITTWKDDKGYGFITPADGGKDVFVHIKAFSNRKRRPEMNQLITYELSTDLHGRPCAVNVTVPGGRVQQKDKKKSGSLSVFVAIAFFAIVGFSVFSGKIPPVILALYLGVSIITFILYAVDKSAAQKGGWRTQESTLHFFSLAGGWPGAIVAQQKLRHKSKKQSFRFVFWLTVLVNCGVFAWLFTADGTANLETLINTINVKL